ncbi:SLC13 family permease [Photobacterium galatheae]|uniref:Dihydroorotate dehydrogenase n=1 Tax=Photobacterium galatheae TaxID=1654360 RepID=A0A066RPE8_9GAMM|nr:SLC13 family permease [Photobacterium galatheae]KDM92199.1 dihydroorotate dehydrogenase [Photobacterium galatheae]MCM0151324.1 SLC13 family permease [Photobacterium galatheae]
MPELSFSQLLKLLFAFGLPFALLQMPTESLPLDGLTLIQHRLLAIFVMAALLWVLEPVPVYATSLLIIVLELVLLSDQSLLTFRHSAGETPLGELLPYTDIFHAFASPIIMLFLGGFALAIAAAKYRLDTNLARVLLRPFGNEPRYIMLGLMLITAIFSMFMSNTATTVMMLALLAPILAAVPKEDSGVKALVLAVPVAANTGGIATPIGTPPNAIALQYLTEEHSISFLEWMAIGLPFVLVQLGLAWWLLQRLFPTRLATLELRLEGQFQHNWHAWVVYLTFGATILLWLTTALHGMNAYVVALIPLTVFALTGIIGKEELKLFNWDVLWLVAGGIAIGMALEKTGLARQLAHAINYEALPSLLILALLSLLCWLMANFMSNTATANLLMPIGAAIATSVPALANAGGLPSMLVILAFSASLGMVLPVSTPPNSLAYSTGLFDSRDMMKIGVLVGLSGLLLLYLAALLIL